LCEHCYQRASSSDALFDGDIVRRTGSYFFMPGNLCEDFRLAQLGTHDMHGLLSYQVRLPALHAGWKYLHRHEVFAKRIPYTLFCALAQRLVQLMLKCLLSAL
jgi:hypothetical protein